MRERCRTIVLWREASPREHSLAFLLSISSCGASVLKSWAASNLSTISLAIASYKRTDPICFAFQLLRAFVVCLSLKSRHLKASTSLASKVTERSRRPGLPGGNHRTSAKSSRNGIACSEGGHSPSSVTVGRDRYIQRLVQITHGPEKLKPTPLKQTHDQGVPVLGCHVHWTK